MTAKQLLHDYVDGLTEDDAAVTAALLLPDRGRRLTEHERAAIDAGLAEADANELIPLEDIEREFGTS
jgi:predicted transcriptional regulator